jgi:8-oxo-dGTP pyrophosphatase MutT (NUDIX family)
VRHRVRVVAYVTRGGDLLVLRYSGEGVPPTGLEVPGGGVDAGEDLIDAVHREVEEETGLTGLQLVGKLGVSEFVANGCRHEQHFFRLEAPADTPDAWEHIGTGGAEDEGYLFECRFMPTADAIVHESQSVFLSAL